NYGGDSITVAAQLSSGVTQIFSSSYAFAALKSDGSVVTWGDSSYGGNSSAVAAQLSSGVTQIFSNDQAFAALKSDGSVVSWGNSGYGGDSSTVAHQLVNVVGMADISTDDWYSPAPVPTNTPPSLAAPSAPTFTDTPSDDTFAPASGTLLGNDPDPGTTLAYGISGGTVSSGVSTRVGTYGTLAVNTATCAWTYSPNNAAIQGLKANAVDSFTATVSDGQASVSRPFNVAIIGANDPTVFGGATTGNVSKDGVLTVAGILTVSDRDTGDAVIAAQPGTAGTYGTFSIGANGVWNYILNNSAAVVRALGSDQVVSDTFTVSTAGGVTRNIVINVAGSQDTLKETTLPMTMAAAHLAARAYSDAHYLANATLPSDAVDQVNAGVSTWTALPAGLLDFTPAAEQVLHDSGNMTRFENGHASASVGLSILNGQKTLVIAFEGTNSSLFWSDPVQCLDLWDDFALIDRHYKDLKDFAAAVAKFAEDPANGIERVLVTGHSLGGAMAQYFMYNFGAANPKYFGVTFGQPGTAVQGHIPDERMVNFIHTNDIVPISGENLKQYIIVGSRVKVSVDISSDPIEYGLKEHTLLTLDGSAHSVSYTDSLKFILNEIDEKSIFQNINLLIGTENSDILNTTFVANITAFGGKGNDFIFSSAGVDRFYGDPGDDVYFVNSTLDVVVENSGEGYDTIVSSVACVLPEYVERLILTGGLGFESAIGLVAEALPGHVDRLIMTGGVLSFENINGTGNGLNNIIIGNSGANVLNGLAGADTLNGGLGKDTYLFLASGNDVDTIELKNGDRIEVSGLPDLSVVGSSGTGSTLSMGQVQLNPERDVLYIGTDNVPGKDITIMLSAPLVASQSLVKDATGIYLKQSWWGKVIDGYIAGADIFIDANGNGLADPGESTNVFTDAQGNFNLTDIDVEGALIAVGGTNIDTGLSNSLLLTSPDGSSVISPLTTLVHAYATTQGVNSSVAQVAVREALGISSAINLNHYDPLAQPAGDSTALAAQKIATQIAVIGMLAERVGVDFSSVVEGLAEAIAVHAGVSLTSEANLSAVLGDQLPQNLIGEAARINSEVGAVTAINGITAIVQESLETDPPRAVAFSPVDGSVDVAVGANIVVTFNEAIQRGTGHIVLKTTGGLLVASYDIATSYNLTLNGNTLTIDPSLNLAHETQYIVEIPEGAIRDLAWNSFSGTLNYDFTTGSGPAVQPEWSETQVNTFTDGHQECPAIATLSDGGYVIVWQSQMQAQRSQGIYAQRFAADGSTVGPEITIGALSVGSQEHPAVAALPGGGFVITCFSLRQGSDGYDIYSQSFAADGSTSGTATRVNTQTEGYQVNPSVATLSDGGHVIVWSDRWTQKIYAQHFAPDGSAVGGEKLISAYTKDSFSHSAIAALENGGYVIAWSSSERDDEGFGVYVQRFEADGSYVGPEQRINAIITSNQEFPAIAALNDGGYIITWQSLNTDGRHDIYSQRFSSGGVTIGEVARINTITTPLQSETAVTALSDGGYVITWQNFDTNTLDNDIYARRFAANGVALGAETQINTYTEGPQ
ncbi:MAG: hypothetical protein GXY42_12350, partial [Desulfovibrionales bacterium]|nr:hypothetical protein [Desulfovibrionales bacterium]